MFSCNKYNVGLNKEAYFIRLSDGTPVKSYTPHCSPAVMEAIESELEKLKRAGFIEHQIVLIQPQPFVSKSQLGLYV